MDISTKRKSVLIDTDSLVALRDKVDSNHGLASKIALSLREARVSLVTSSFVFGEVITVISQKLGHPSAVAFIQKFPDTDVLRIEVDDHLIEKAIEVFSRQTSKNVSFTDCVNMAILEKFGLKEIFSFDRDYKKNGFLRIGIDTKLEGEVVEDKKE